jgi:hypothetical protein
MAVFQLMEDWAWTLAGRIAASIVKANRSIREEVDARCFLMFAA